MNPAARPPANAGRQRKSLARRGPQPPKASADPRVPADTLLPFCSFAAAMAGFTSTSHDPRLSPDL